MRIILFFLVFLSCTNDPKVVQEFVSGKELPIEQIKEAELIQTENGNIKVHSAKAHLQHLHMQTTNLCR